VDHKVAIVTGASRGIGAATARRLAAAGYSVAIASRSVEELDALAVAIDGDGGTALVVPTDVVDPAALERLVEATVDRFGRVDVLVHNAGVLPPATRSERMTLDGWSQTLAVNLTGPWWLANRAFDEMKSTGDGGVIINLTSTAASYPSVGFAAYNASKAALTMLTKTLALEWARSNVRVVGIAPGKVDTVMVEPIVAYTEQAGRPLNPLARIGTPGEVADLVCFLVSEQAAFITGTIITIDGGELLEH
jgi:NAD(P)-dependent dehydrogenase (short-subunit alcohol dehydrogenase family)